MSHVFPILFLMCCMVLSGCGEQTKRPCVERAECFAGEYCNDSGVCAPYKGKRKTKAQPDNVGVPIAPRDMGQDE
jgi:hypothetical protein